MLQAKKEEELKKSGKKLNSSLCEPGSAGADAESGIQPNIVLNLDGLNQNKKSEKNEIFKIEEKIDGANALNSLNSSTDSDDDDFSPQNS